MAKRLGVELPLWELLQIIKTPLDKSKTTDYCVFCCDSFFAQTMRKRILHPNAKRNLGKPSKKTLCEIFFVSSVLQSFSIFKQYSTGKKTCIPYIQFNFYFLKMYWKIWENWGKTALKRIYFASQNILNKMTNK